MAQALTVTDLLIARPGFEADLERDLQIAIAAERAAALGLGAETFELHRDRQRPGSFLVLERWNSQAAFDAFHAHHRPRELTAFLPRADALLARPLEDSVFFWTPQLI